MKLKSFFLIFNIVLIISFVTVFFLPLIVMDLSFLQEFWKSNWYLSVIFISVVLIVNTVFIMNWTELRLLEQQDWPGLSHVMENRIYNKNRYRFRDCHLLCEALFLLGDFKGITKLDDWLERTNPSYRAKMASRLAASYYLDSRYERARAVIDQALSVPSRDHDILLLYRELCVSPQVLSPDSVSALRHLAGSTRDPLVSGIAAMLLARRGGDAEAFRKDIIRRITPADWAERAEDARSGIPTLVLGPLIRDTGKWLFENEPESSSR